MKKTVCLLLICASFSFSFNQKANAQLKYGGGIFFGTWLNNPGLSVRAEFDVFEGLTAVPKIEISFPRFNTGTFLNAVALHLHYYVEVTEGIAVYPLAGITVKSYLDIDKYGNNRLSHNFGLNPTFGAGGKLKITDSFAVFAEGRYDFGRYHQFVTTLGVLMTPGG